MNALLRTLPGRARLWRLKERLYLGADFVRSAVTAGRHEHLFDTVEKYSMFVGYPRSGHSLVGALLTAHPDFVISHELDALKYVRAGFSRNQLFTLILKKDRDFVQSGGEWTGYQYSLPGASQGEFRELAVIGDKKGGSSSLQIAGDADILPRLRELVRMPLRFIHVVRNPYDNIATMQRKIGLSLSEVIDRYRVHCRGSALALDFAEPGSAYTFRHEELIADPSGVMQRLCEFLGRPASEAYLDACEGRVFDSPRKTRFDAPWTESDKRAVQRLMEDFQFLLGYNFDD